MSLTYLRTPDERFAMLPDYPWTPSYLDVHAEPQSESMLRLHYVDDGPPDATETVLLLHGEPSWSYLYRHMIPPLVSSGYRCVAPDLIGFGRSDKPTERDDYTYARHVEWLREGLFDRLDLSDITLMCQDWGGLLGLRLVAEHPDRFRRVVAANTFLPTGDTPAGPAFLAWQQYSQDVDDFPIGSILQRASVRELSAAEIAAYDAPFPDELHKAGARQFPLLVPTAPDDPAADANRRAWEFLRTFDRPFLCAFSDQDPITRGADRVIIEHVAGAAGQRHVTLAGGGHFLQEDVGPELAAAIITLIDQTPNS